MKKILIIMLVLSSCSPDWHIRRAKFKQPDILSQYNDTIRLQRWRVDTLYYNDTFELVKTFYEVDTVIQTKYIAPKTRYETRWKYRTIRDTVRIIERTNRIESRQENRTERQENRQQGRTNRQWSKWWFALIIGLVVGYFGRMLRNNYI